MSIRAVLLDFGGTLDSEGKHWSTQLADAFGAAGLCVERAVLDRAFLASDRALAADSGTAHLRFDAYVEQQVRGMLDQLAMDPAPARTVAGHFTARARAHVERNRRLLAQHRGRLRYALVSNFTPNLPLILDDLGLGQAFDRVLCSAIEGVKKPEPAIFQRALAALGALPAQAAMIGDSLGNDVVPARQLGLRSVWLRGDANHGGGDPAAADHVVGCFADALAVCLEGAPS